MRIAKYFIAPALMLALAGCGKTYGNADCVKKVDESTTIAFSDVNHNGTVDEILTYNCRTRPGTFGMDHDCIVDETHVLNNNYSDSAWFRNDGSARYEIGKRTPKGEDLQKQFDTCKAEQK
ncbi:MAG: hypothetical protein AABX14_05220 [Candidatus Aenigmatarchaeota archaeon]